MLVQVESIANNLRPNESSTITNLELVFLQPFTSFVFNVMFKCFFGLMLTLDPVKEILPDLIRENSRNLNVVLSILAEKHQINVCKITLQNFLKEAKI